MYRLAFVFSLQILSFFFFFTFLLASKIVGTFNSNFATNVNFFLLLRFYIFFLLSCFNLFVLCAWIVFSDLLTNIMCEERNREKKYKFCMNQLWANDAINILIFFHSFLMCMVGWFQSDLICIVCLSVFICCGYFFFSL